MAGLLGACAARMLSQALQSLCGGTQKTRLPVSGCCCMDCVQPCATSHPPQFAPAALQLDKALRELKKYEDALNGQFLRNERDEKVVNHKVQPV